MYGASFIILYYNKQIHINITTVYITTLFPCVISTATCFDILCHHQTVTHLLLAKLHSSWIAAVELHKIVVVKMLKYYVVITVK
jgi:hypothetical protein